MKKNEWNQSPFPFLLEDLIDAHELLIALPDAGEKQTTRFVRLREESGEDAQLKDVHQILHRGLVRDRRGASEHAGTVGAEGQLRLEEDLKGRIAEKTPTREEHQTRIVQHSCRRRRRRQATRTTTTRDVNLI